VLRAIAQQSAQKNTSGAAALARQAVPLLPASRHHGCPSWQQWNRSMSASTHEYAAQVSWSRAPAEKFVDNRYSRRHRWQFDGGIEVPASSSPQVVPLPMSAAAAVDPEEALVAALSSCHMLFFLSYAARRGFVVDRYDDHAVGTMGRNAAGRMAMLKVSLRPVIAFGGDLRPSAEELAALHHQSHQDCFIANSVHTAVVVESD
jgi:organic hydroperoxide reductase OsmC/OhrA